MSLFGSNEPISGSNEPVRDAFGSLAICLEKTHGFASPLRNGFAFVALAWRADDVEPELGRLSSWWQRAIKKKRNLPTVGRFNILRIPLLLGVGVSAWAGTGGLR